MLKSMNSFKNRFRHALRDSNLTQQELSEKTKIPKSSISQYLSGYAKPKNERVYKIAHTLGVNEAWLLGFDVDMEIKNSTNILHPSCHSVPILGTICISDDIYCEQNYQGSFFIDSSIKADLCIKVSGNNMKDAGIKDGDYAFIKKVYDYENGKIYACLLKDENESVLKVLHQNDQSMILSPANSDYEPIVRNTGDVLIIGKCIGIYHTVWLENLKKYILLGR